MSFLSYDLYKLHVPKMKRSLDQINTNENELTKFLNEIKNENLYLMLLQDKEEFRKIIPNLLKFAKFLIIKKMNEHKVYKEKLSFMIDFIQETNYETIRKTNTLKFVRFCIEVCILSLNIYNKTILVTKMQESSLKLKPILINKMKYPNVEYPFVIVLDSSELTFIFSVSDSLLEIKNHFNKFMNAQSITKAKSTLNQIKDYDKMLYSQESNIVSLNNKLSNQRTLSIENQIENSVQSNQITSPKITSITAQDKSKKIFKFDKKEELETVESSQKYLMNLLSDQKKDIFQEIITLNDKFAAQTDLIKMLKIKKLPKRTDVRNTLYDLILLENSRKKTLLEIFKFIS